MDLLLLLHPTLSYLWLDMDNGVCKLYRVHHSFCVCVCMCVWLVILFVSLCQMAMDGCLCFDPPIKSQFFLVDSMLQLRATFTGGSQAPDALIFCRSKKLQISRKFGSILVIYNANYMPRYSKILTIRHNVFHCEVSQCPYMWPATPPHWAFSELCTLWLCNYYVNFVVATIQGYTLRLSANDLRTSRFTTTPIFKLFVDSLYKLILPKI